jgi:ADP-ribose pyrophosphatase
VTQDDKFLCLRQTKYSVEGTSLAPVGGYLEPGEDPLTAARRELLEETGYEAPDWISLGRYPVDGNRGAGTAYLFLAQGARRVTKANADDLEEQELLHLSRFEVEAALASGAFKLLPWTAAAALALLYLDREK